jgi:hypothetical protein
MPACLQLLERVLDDVFGGLHVADHHYGQPDQGKMMLSKQPCHCRSGIRPAGHRLGDIGFHT